MRSVRLLINLAMLLLASAVASTARAELATESEARQVCENWIHRLTLDTGGWRDGTVPAIRLVRSLESDGTVLGYAFSLSPTGYVVVPALKELPPIKAYSRTGHIVVEVETGIVAILKQSLKGDIDAFRSIHGSLDATGTGRSDDRARDCREMWHTLLGQVGMMDDRLDSRGSFNQVGPLLTSQWHQRAPYNDYCPLGQGNTVVGCVGTAAAQVMLYHKWPPSGVGSVTHEWDGDDTCDPDDPVAGGTLFANLSDAYDWAAMPDICTPDDPVDQQQAVAELCYEVAVASGTDFGACGSEAYYSDLASALITYFEYATGIDYESRTSYSDAAWFDLLKVDLDQTRPLLYSIVTPEQDPDGNNIGHALVCDGYQEDYPFDFIHLNYGWTDYGVAYCIDNYPEYYPEGFNNVGWYNFDLIPGSTAWADEGVLRGIAPHYVPNTHYVPTQFPTIQAAIDDAGVIDGDQIVVLPDSQNNPPNTPYAGFDFREKRLTVLGLEGPHATSINGHIIAEGVQTATTSKLKGFSLIGCEPRIEIGDDYNDLTALTVEDCMLSGGGTIGIRIWGRGTTIIRDCKIQGFSKGVTIYHSANPTVEDCLFYGNARGITMADDSRATVTRCRILNSGAEGIETEDNACPTIRNCVIAGSNYNALYIDSDNQTISITNCVLDGGGENGVYISHGTADLRNCIVTNNGYRGIEADNGNAYVNYCDFWNNNYGNYTGAVYWGTGNGSCDPLFVNRPAQDYHLLWQAGAYSCCVDMGDPSILDAYIPPGHNLARSDMGAYGGAKNGWPPEYAVTVYTSPVTLTITVDGVDYPSPQTFTWPEGDTHELCVPLQIDIAPGERYGFDGWSDGEQSACRIIEVTGAASYEANYAHEFELTVATDPPDLVEIPGAGWYPAVAEVVLAAPEEAGGLTFSHWTVDGSAPMYESTIPVTMDAPHDAVAYYTDVVENTISGRVADTGDAPIEGVHMTGFLEDVFTDADGLYSGAVASGWEGTIEPVLDCWEFTPPSITYPPVDQDLADQDYVGTRLTYTISGRVEDGEDNPLAGVQLVGLCGDMYTEPDGTYSCQVDCGWSGTVTPQLAGWSFTPPSRTYDDVHEDWSDQDYEGGTAEPIHVSNAGSDQTGDGSPGNPYATISHALSVSAYGDVVQVACGTYPEHELQMTTGVTLRGNPDDPGCVVVDAEQQGRVIECLECDDATLVTGITFTGGLVSSGSYPDNSGAGVYVFGGAPRFDHCIFTGNDAKAAGGVLCDQGADATFDHCLFHGNIVETQGGGIGVLRASQVAMQSCTVAGNTSTAATNANGGVYAYSNGAHIDLYECIVAFNTGIGVMCWNETGTITLHDSDVYGNTGGDWVNCIAGQEANPCNMSADPLFCDAAVGDYALDAASPCLPANNDCGVQMGAFGEGCGGVQYVIISGTVTDQDGGPLHPVLLHGFPGGEVFTDAYGVYSATVPGGWSGTVQPIRGDCVFTPPLREYADVQSDQIDQDYEGQCCVTSLFEAWETAIDTGTWQIWGSPAPIIRPGLGWDGSDGLDPNGDGSYASGVLSLAQYGFGPGASLSARFMSNVENVPRGNYFQVIRFGFTGPELECGGECVRDSLSISVAISQENGNGEKIMVCRGGVGTLYEEPYPPSEDAIWHHAELRMLEDGRIEYWLDGELRYTSPDPIPISSPLNVYVDGRSLGIINILDDLQLIDCSAGFTPAEPAPPASLALGQNFPNPFNPTTTIHFGLSAAGEVRLTVHDIGGRLVHTLIAGVWMSEGSHAVVWDGRDDTGQPVPSGVYFYRLEHGRASQMRKMVIVK